MISKSKIDNFLWEVEKVLMNRYGVDVAQRDMSTLYWYINTGRACVEFLNLLVKAKPFMVARRLHNGGSDEEIIKRVKYLIGFDDVEKVF